MFFSYDSKRKLNKSIKVKCLSNIGPKEEISYTSLQNAINNNRKQKYLSPIGDLFVTLNLRSRS